MCHPIWEMHGISKTEASSWQVKPGGKAFEELRLHYSNVFKVLHSRQKQDMTSQGCTAAANMIVALLSSKDAKSPASS